MICEIPRRNRQRPPRCGNPSAPRGCCRLLLVTHGSEVWTGEDIHTNETWVSEKVRGSANDEIHWLILAASDGQGETLCLWRDALREEVPSTFFLWPEDAPSLKRTLDQIALLGASDPLLQAHGQAALADIMYEQGDALGSGPRVGPSKSYYWNRVRRLTTEARPGELRALRWRRIEISLLSRFEDPRTLNRSASFAVLQHTTLADSEAAGS